MNDSAEFPAMRPLLEEYIRLEKTAPLRANKLQAMQGLLAAFDAEEPLSLSEITALVQAVDIRQPVFEKLIYPTLEARVEAQDIEAVKLLVKLIQQLYAYQTRYKKWKYSLTDLLRIGLRINPLDDELRHRKYDSEVRAMLYSIHEVPSGVLWDNNGASESQCQELLEYADEFERLSKALSKDDAELIAECRYYYRSYGAYLASRPRYASFAAYLEQHPR